MMDFFLSYVTTSEEARKQSCQLGGHLSSIMFMLKLLFPLMLLLCILKQLLQAGKCSMQMLHSVHCERRKSNHKSMRLAFLLHMSKGGCKGTNQFQCKSPGAEGDRNYGNSSCATHLKHAAGGKAGACGILEGRSTRGF
eukprot:1159685-Pelagomonas_calceolata.AAC.6